MKLAFAMSDATVERYAEHRRFDRSVALFDKYETRHKFGTASNQGVAEEWTNRVILFDARMIGASPNW
jgi:hypothetical protein